MSSIPPRDGSFELSLPIVAMTIDPRAAALLAEIDGLGFKASYTMERDGTAWHAAVISQAGETVASLSDSTLAGALEYLRDEVRGMVPEWPES